MQDFNGTTAVVTGGTEGIGERVAETLFARGAAVVLCARNGDAAERKAQEIDPTGKRCLGLACDVSDEAQVAALIAAAVEKFGGLHLAVNNAGTPGPGPAELPDIPLADWHMVIATNLTGTFLCLKHEIPAIIASGGGAIVNLSAANGIVGAPGLAPYTATKHGILGLTRTAALECADKGVRINAIGPGYVETPKIRQAPQELQQVFHAAHPMGRMGRRSEVADLIAFLLSEQASFCTGGFYPADGGYTAQ
ncbi:SDR family NAD(P)-dependent oxidoreductase [Pseudoruegeria sp. HB172150]|uniref:SDR family NAD(P)-dependent oxidoreductase n=1 Tax=Pseudoruegeria sp. HB172150 TaxID=2721164 RepID=UPI00155833CD|nr:SDR family NAD(P)-dependent oxidoreductase [Pseudoruegeria sp. HB172150]